MAKVKKKTIKKKVGAKPTAKGKKPIARKAPAKKKIAKVKPAKKPVKRVVASATRRPSGLPEQLRDAALKVLNERQAENIVSFDLAGRSPIADYLIVASGRASRQLAAIAQYLDEAFTKLGVSRTRIEGLPEANWVLVDGGDILVHLFLPEVRGYYDLEGIWNKRGA